MTSPELLPAATVVILLIILQHVEHSCVRRAAKAQGHLSLVLNQKC